MQDLPSPYTFPQDRKKTYALVKEYLKIILTAHKTMPTEIFLPLRLPIKRYTK
jgi:hypothetical protein